MLSAWLPVHLATASECALTESRASLASLNGVRIASVDIASEGPDLPDPLQRFAALHAVSRSSVIRRQILFAPGDTVDSLMVGETMRRLRAQRLFSDVVLSARRCEPGGSVALTLRTRDTWTLKPTARLRGTSHLSVGVEDKNFLGTGRVVSVTREMTLYGSGAAATYVDPFVLGSNISTNVRIAHLAGGRTLRLGLRKREHSVLDAWRAEGNFSSLSYRDTVSAEKGLHTVSAMTLVGRRISTRGYGVTSLLLGAEFDSAASISPSRRGVAPGAPHVRSFIGIDIGLQRRTVLFDSAGWIAPGRAFLDVPLGWEGEGIIAVGEERDIDDVAMKYDAWLGRVWLPRRGRILMLDGWASSYLGRGLDRNQITRVSMSTYSEAWAGMWGARLTAEQLVELDPDRRGLSLLPVADYTSPIVRPFGARGGRAVAASLDRDFRVRKVGATSVLNVGGFGAVSHRWRVDDVPGGELHAGVLGARVRLLSAHGTISSIRVDVGYPVYRSEVLSGKPYVVVTYGTLFDASRQRDGRRVY